MIAKTKKIFLSKEEKEQHRLLRNYSRALQAFERLHTKEDNGCWLWTGFQDTNLGKRKSAVPILSYNNGNVNAARFMYEHVNKVKLGRYDKLKATCNCAICVNPAHRVLASKADS